MERESFDDEEVAEILNDSFVSIKVDREERKDIDSVYMKVCQALTGRGGWPLTLILTPDQKPLFAGTYFPKHNSGNRLGLIEILSRVSNMWLQDKDELIKKSNEITNILNKQKKIDVTLLCEDDIKNAINQYTSSYDHRFGGFSKAPKFPTPHNLCFLLKEFNETKDESLYMMAEDTLNKMYRGGIYDHIGYGFSRYSTDKYWLVPHFEKMLYDNALLINAYIDLYLVSKKEEYKRIVEEVIEYLTRDMLDKLGGFYSAEDADSEGIEGKFYLFNKDEIINLLGEKVGEEICAEYNVIERGNFEGKNILNLIFNPNDLDELKMNEEVRNILFDYRDKRIHPHKDKKILTSWNGLVIASLAKAGRVFENEVYTNYAKVCTNFILNNLVVDNRIMASYIGGEVKYKGYLDDYAFFINGLLEIYCSTFESEYLEKAIKYSKDTIKLFYDNKDGGFFLYGKDSEKLIVNPKELYDGAIPSGTSVMINNLITLYKLAEVDEFKNIIDKSFKFASNSVKKYPMGYSVMLQAFTRWTREGNEIILVGDKNEEKTMKIISFINRTYLPKVTFLFKDVSDNRIIKLIPHLKYYEMIDELPTIYMCANNVCDEPVTGFEEFKEVMKDYL